MDKRLELTEKQKELVEKYNDIVNEMPQNDIKFVFRAFEEIRAFNGNQVEDHNFLEDASDDDIIVPIEDLQQVACPFGLNLCWGCDNSIAVTFK